MNDAATYRRSRTLAAAPFTFVNDLQPIRIFRDTPGFQFLLARGTKTAMRHPLLTTPNRLLDSLGTSSFLASHTRHRSSLTSVALKNSVIESTKYEELIAKESQHWGDVQQDPGNPQIWHDPRLFEIFFGSEYRHLVESAVVFGPSILELGCGEGNLSFELASRGLRVTGIDLSPQRIEEARSRAKNCQFNIPPTFTVGDLNTISLPVASFDCVVAHDSLHHILQLSRLCDEAKKSLKPGGHFLVMDYIGMGFVRKLLAGSFYAILPTHQSYRTKWGLRKRLSAFLASEQQKRRALEGSSSRSLHHDSPFEEISQESIVEEISSRFDIIEQRTFCPFWFYFAAKIRMPDKMKYPVARFLRSFDDFVLRLRFSRGAYVWIVAHKSSTIN